MGDDLFRGRFKPGAAPAADDDDDSGLSYRNQRGLAGRPGEGEVNSAVDTLPALPTVVTKILARVGNAYSSAADLEELIKQDMVIAGRLLKMVNSPFYGLPQPVAGITQAVAIIGFASLKSLVLAASTSNLMVVDLSSYGFQPEGLWKNSIATAAVARAIGLSNGTGKDDAEEYFVAGLLRDVGMLVLGPFLKRRGIRLTRIEGEHDILTAERQALGFDHCWVGDRVADKWNLPDALRMCIAKHHRIPASASDKDLKQLAAVRLAERLVYAAGVGVSPDHTFDKRIDEILIKAAGLDSPGFQQLMTDMPRLLSSAGEAMT
jgi:HD-like signal output (HDOD) protein